jgi:hypothetical protein
VEWIAASLFSFLKEDKSGAQQIPIKKVYQSILGKSRSSKGFINNKLFRKNRITQ